MYEIEKNVPFGGGVMMNDNKIIAPQFGAPEFKWVQLGAYQCVADPSGRILAKILVTNNADQPNQIPQPFKTWVYGKYVGEFISSRMARESAEKWLRLGPPTRD